MGDEEIKSTHIPLVALLFVTGALLPQPALSTDDLPVALRSDIESYIREKLDCRVLKTPYGRKLCANTVTDYRQCRIKAAQAHVEHTCFNQWREYQAILETDAESFRSSKPGVRIGMTKNQVREQTHWGKPTTINTTIVSGHSEEQWVYPNDHYIYFRNGRVTAIQTRE